MPARVYELAKTQYSFGQRAEGDNNLLKSLKLDKEKGQLLQDREFIKHIKVLFEERREFAQGIEVLNQAVEAQKRANNLDYFDTQIDIGHLLDKQGKTDEARNSFIEIVNSVELGLKEVKQKKGTTESDIADYKFKLITATASKAMFYKQHGELDKAESSLEQELKALKSYTFPDTILDKLSTCWTEMAEIRKRRGNIKGSEAATIRAKLARDTDTSKSVFQDLFKP